MKQSRFMSLFETCASTATGFGISYLVQMFVCWWKDLPLSGFDNLSIIGLFTIASLIRQYGWRRLMEALHVRNPISAFAAAVLAERRRQIEAEGWSTEHDDIHDSGDLARAGASYALSAAYPIAWPVDEPIDPDKSTPPSCWPWEQTWWRPTSPRRDLVKAGALILAEGEKFDRNRKSKKPRL